MFKRAFRVLFPWLLLIASPAFAAGTIPLSMTQQLDQYGVPLSGCQLYIIQAGTTSTPQNAFKDYGLTTTQPNPMLCDSSGRLPQFFLADGQIKVRLLDKLGNPQVTLDNILVIGPTSGGGSGATIDPTTILATGDIKVTYGTGVLTGFVRANGRTVGSATSGATERANADTNPLFLYLWSADANLAVSGGRGASAAADWAANKTIALPDWRGRGITGLADMGNTATTALTSAGCSSDPTILGGPCGFQTTTLAQSALPNVAPTFTGTSTLVTVTSTVNNVAQGVSGTAQASASVLNTIVGTGTLTSTGNFTPVGTVQSINGGVAQTTIPMLSPQRLATIYMKL